MKTILGKNLYTQKEVAAMLGVAPASVALYVKQGRLSTTLIGRVKYITEDGLKLFLSPELGTGQKATQPEPEK